MTKIIAGNWKMNHGPEETKSFMKALRGQLEGASDRILIFPPAISLAAAREALGDSPILLGAQNVYYEQKGAFTGEISIPMLKELSIGFCLVGHSERRHIFGEDSALLNKKVKALLEEGVIPVFCIGEQLADREAQHTFAVLEEQLKTGLAGLPPLNKDNIVLAYEPVWAIGTGKTATPEDAEETMGQIRRILKTLSLPMDLPILYGGSVKPENAGALLGKSHVDGLLIGNASLAPESFAAMIKWRKE